MCRSYKCRWEAKRFLNNNCSTQAANGLRPGMATVPGAQIPYPYGGKQRQIMVDIDPDKLYSYDLSPVGCFKRDQCAESDSAGGNGEDWHD